MNDSKRTGSGGIIPLGLAAMVLIAGVAMLSWALGIERLPGSVDPSLGGDAAASFGQLASGGVGDTARVVRLGQLEAELDESSGLAVSRQHEGVVWTHNDGDDARLFAIQSNGTPVGAVDVVGVDVDDWEDMARARCPTGLEVEGDCLFMGDIGDNDDDREVYYIDIVAEPQPEAGGDVQVLSRIAFRFPDGPADTEALAVTDRGEALLATKGNDGSSRLYRLSVVGDSTAVDSDGVRVARLIGSLPLVVDGDRERITGAAMSPDGRVFAVRNHHAVFLFDMTRLPGAPVLCEIGAWQPQGEGVDFLSDNMLILTSEQEGGRAPVIRLRCP